MAKMCYFQKTKQPLILSVFICTIIVTECVIGIIANGFIVAVSAAQRVPNNTGNISSRILVFLSMSRIALESFMIIGMPLSTAFPSLYNHSVVYITVNLGYMFLNYCSLWFAAWLSFFYFVKIANFSNRLFLRLKWRISRWMPWLLWLSVFVSMGYSVFFVKDLYTVHCSKYFSVSSNSTEKYFTKTTVVTLVFLYSLGIFLPLSIFLLAATLLIASLKRHALHMENRSMGCRSPSRQAHVSAIKKISYFLVFYILGAVALFLNMSNILEYNGPVYILCMIITISYPAGHSVLLILDNPRLRRTWKRLQHQIYLYLKGQTP